MLARTVLLAAHGFALSAPIMTDAAVGQAVLDAELDRAAPEVSHAMTPTPAATSRIHAGLDGVPDSVDLVVIGLGVTGAGVALDAASRGLSVLAVDAHDVAFGTSRWSSKLVHGGLRYLASLQLGIAHESAVERGILMERTAPHLTRALPWLLPLTGSVSTAQAAMASAGFRTGDLLRLAARTRRDTLPRPRRVSRTEALGLAPALRPEGLRGGLVFWDGQLEDDARLVTCLARTAASYGAHVRTRARVIEATGTGVVLRDELTGADAHRGRAGRRQRGRRVVGRPRRRDPAAAEPGHPRGAARGGHPRPDGRPSPCPCRAAAAATSWRCPSPRARSTSA